MIYEHKQPCDTEGVMPCPVPGCASGARGEKVRLFTRDGWEDYRRIHQDGAWKWGRITGAATITGMVAGVDARRSMSCDKQHVTSAGFMGLIREREELMQEVEILRAQLVMARDGALEEALAIIDATHLGEHRAYLVGRVRSLKGAR